LKYFSKYTIYKMSEVFENPNASVAPTPKKEKRKRKPLTEEQKKALVERLKKAREAKKAKKQEPKVEPKPVPTVPTQKVVVEQPKPEMKVEEPKKDDKTRERELEIANLRHELELQKLRNELEKARKPPRKPRSRTILPVEEDDEPEPVVKDKPKVMSVAESKAHHMESIVEEAEPVNVTPPKPKKIVGRLAPKNIWDF